MEETTEEMTEETDTEMDTETGWNCGEEGRRRDSGGKVMGAGWLHDRVI